MPQQNRQKFPKFLGRNRRLINARDLTDSQKLEKGLLEVSYSAHTFGAATIRVTPFSLKSQQSTNWCWAAVAQSVLYTKGRQLSQLEIVQNHVAPSCILPSDDYFGEDDNYQCGPSGCTAVCNGLHDIEPVLNEFNAFDREMYVTNEQISFSNIESEIRNNRPVVVLAIPDSRLFVNHFVLIVSVTRSALGNHSIEIASPSYDDGFSYDKRPFSLPFSALGGGFSLNDTIYRAGWVFATK